MDSQDPESNLASTRESLGQINKSSEAIEDVVTEGESNQTNASSSNDATTTLDPKDFTLRLPAEFETYENACNRYIEYLSKHYPHYDTHDRRVICALTLGFDEEELVEKHALSMTPDKSIPLNEMESNLTNDVHPIFAFERWEGVPNYIYEAMIPALRLASLFITHRSCSAFWHTLVSGKREAEFVSQDVLSIDSSGTGPRLRIRELKEWTLEGEQAWFHCLDTATSIMKLCFTKKPGNLNCCHAVCQSTQSGVEMASHEIRMNADYFTVTEKIATTRNLDPMMRLRFNLVFAAVLVHELAHAMEWTSRIMNFPHREDETYLLEDNFAEAGFAWERIMFGGIILPIGNRVDTPNGVALLPYMSEINYIPAHSVSMDRIYALQRTETYRDVPWQNLGWKHYHIPKEGAPGYGWEGVRGAPQDLSDSGSDMEDVSDSRERTGEKRKRD